MQTVLTNAKLILENEVVTGTIAFDANGITAVDQGKSSLPGAVDLGNSTAGGYVSVDGESIQFANIGAGGFVTLNASGTAPGAEGIAGGSIDAGSTIILSGLTIATKSS